MREADKTKLAAMALLLAAAAAWGQDVGYGPGSGMDDVLGSLPAALARLEASRTSSAEGPGRRNWLDVADPRGFSSFVCGASREVVDRALAEAGDALNLDLLMACDGCNVAALRRLLDYYREDSPHPERADASASDPWRAVAPTAVHRTRYYGVAERDCLMYRHRYAGGGRAATFLGIAHAISLPPPARERLFARMGREFEEAEPGAIVIEGRTGRPSCGEMMHYFFASDPPRDELERSMIYGARHGVEIVGGEPPYSGFVPPDGPGYQVLSAMGHGMPFDAALSTLIRQYSPEQIAPFDTMDEFTAWYRRINGREFSVGEAYNDSTPAEFLPAEMVRESNRTISRQALARNDQLLATIRGALSRHERVVTVYGSGHMPATGPALEEHVGAIDPATSRCAER